MGAQQIDRRTLLLGAATLGLGLAGCSASGSGGSSTGGPGSSASAPKVAAGVTLIQGQFRSPARKGIAVDYEVILPPGHQTLAGLPVCLVLHGRGDDHRAAVGLVHLDVALANVVKAGAPPFALVAMDGGDHTYWHKRADGDDPQAMLLTELLPRLKAASAKTDRFALFGWSMGAYGSLLLAERVGKRVAFVAADSPALWLSPGDSAAGAFDDREDFLRNDVFAGRPKLAGVPVRVVCGQSDSFLGATQEFVKGVPDLVAADYPPGGHTGELWAATAAAQLMPLARALV